MLDCKKNVWLKSSEILVGKILIQNSPLIIKNKLTIYFVIINSDAVKYYEKESNKQHEKL